tara:strand:- start:551 stop:1783 length:1233 start_codon:yes stop_codon:yes gene_type:complete
MSGNLQSNRIVTPIFIATIIVVFLLYIPIVFPALFSSLVGSYSDTIKNPFEFGHQALILIVSNIIILGFGFAYYKQKLPNQFQNSIEKIRSFEISKKTTLIVFFIILGIYITLSTPELFLDEKLQWDDYESVLLPALELWPDGESDNPYIQEQNDRYVRMYLLDTSLNVFQNIKLLPFLASIMVVVFTYLLTTQICQKRFAGIIAMAVLLQSNIFLKYDTIAVYENFWVLFYLISLYVLKKGWILSPIFYILAVFSKAYVAPFFIMTLFSTYRSKISRRTKLVVLLSYVAIISIAVIVIFAEETIYPKIFEIDSSSFILGFAATAFQFRSDLLILVVLLPVSIWLFILAKNRLKEADSILFLIFGTITAGPAVVMMTYFYEVLPYRLIPLIVFVAIGIGLFFSKNSKELS